MKLSTSIHSCQFKLGVLPRYSSLVPVVHPRPRVAPVGGVGPLAPAVRRPPRVHLLGGEGAPAPAGQGLDGGGGQALRKEGEMESEGGQGGSGRGDRAEERRKRTTTLRDSEIDKKVGEEKGQKKAALNRGGRKNTE